MTGLITASIVLIVASAGTLAFGWFDQNEQLIWVSIALSVGAAVCLALAYHRSKREAAEPAGAAGAAPSPDDADAPESGADSPGDDDNEPRTNAATATASSTEEFSPLDAAGEAGPAAAAGAPTANAAPTKGRDVSKPAPKPQTDEVVAVPERKKYHRPDCRYAKAAETERMTKAQARRRSYSACGICKP